MTTPQLPTPTDVALSRHYDEAFALEQALARLRWAVVDADQGMGPNLLRDRLDEFTADLVAAGGELCAAAGRATTREPTGDPLGLVSDLLAAASELLEVQKHLHGSLLRPRTLATLNSHKQGRAPTNAWSAGVLDALWPVAASVVEVHRANVIALSGAIDFIRAVDHRSCALALVASTHGGVDREEVQGAAIQPD